MNEASGNFRDSSGAAVRPPIAWALTVVIGLALEVRADQLDQLPMAA